MTQSSTARRSGSLVPARIPRENGFGDFCFGRLLMADLQKSGEFNFGRPKEVLQSEGEWTEEELSANSANVCFVEPDRSFFKLDGDAGTELVEFSISAQESFKSHHLAFSGDLGTYLGEQNGFYEEGNYFPDGRSLSDLSPEEQEDLSAGEQYMSVLSPEEQIEANTQYERVQKAFMLQIKTLPSRCSQYILEAHVEKEGGYENLPMIGGWSISQDHLIRDWSMIKLVRDLSNVSVQLRQELGSVIWANTKIMFPAHKYGGWRSLEPLAFLFERPAIHSGIKSLHLNLPCSDRDEDGISHFKVACHYFPTILKLTHLQIMINGDIGDVEEVISGSDSGSLPRQRPRYYHEVRPCKRFGAFWVNLTEKAIADEGDSDLDCTATFTTNSRNTEKID
ncbi:uncharacterized protein PAC_00040 [Phialocephala subalpina]|uniref:Uncharacterized protein n=1 Tax=Phialocephala subalpina TaxID=576137 RepID=A0A1L7WBK5_9HELO|nr:uncharacterized protein PAC_00040 [Phialocephala subalpina]